MSIAAPITENIVHSTIEFFIVRPILFAIVQRNKDQWPSFGTVEKFQAEVHDICEDLYSQTWNESGEYVLSEDVLMYTCVLIEKAARVGFPGKPLNEERGSILLELFVGALMYALKVY